MSRWDAGAQRGAGDGVLQRDALTEQIGRELARAGGELELVAAQQLDHQRPRGDQRAPALGDQLEDRRRFGLAAERPRDLQRRVKRVDGPLQIDALSLGA